MTLSRSQTSEHSVGLPRKTRPSRLRVILRLAGWVLLCAYLFLTTALLAVRLWVAPNIETFYPKLETYLEERSGIEISTHDIHVDWEWLRPRITLTDVTFSRPGHHASLRLPKLQATFSLSSFFTLQPTFSRLVVISPRLNVERLTESTFNIAGFSVDTSASDKPATGSRGATANKVLDWVLAQEHLEIVDGDFNYIDFTGERPRPVLLHNTNAVLHRYMIAWKFGLQSTAIRENKTPIDIRATFRERHFGSDSRLGKLHGTIFASIPSIDFGRIANRINLDHFLQDGLGQAQVWLDFDNLKLTKLTADVSLEDVSMRWRPDDDPIRVDKLQGRLIETLEGDQFTFSTQDLSIKPIGQDPYYLGNATLQGTWKDRNLSDGTLFIESFDLEALTTIGLQLPIPEEALNTIRDMRARGTIEGFQSSWQGQINAPTSFEFSASFNGVSVQDHIASQEENYNRLGFSNLSGSLTGSNNGGTLTLNSTDCSLSFPGIFFEKDFRLDTLQMQASWSRNPKLEFKVENLLVSNSDASAQVHGGWYDTGDLGTLEVRGDLHYLRASAAHRFIPIVAGGKPTNDWLKAALQGGIAQNGKVDLYGPLRQFPYVNQQDKGYIFRISGEARDVKLDYVPSHRRDQNGEWIPGQWPVIDRINGQMVFEGMSVYIQADSAQSMGATLSDVTAEIPSYTAEGLPLLIKGKSQAPLLNMAQWVNESPVSAMIGNPFIGTSATGDASLDLSLTIPITDLANTKVNGVVSLSENTIKMENVPELSAARGQVTFTEKGVWGSDLSANVYGCPTTGQITTDEKGKIRIEAFSAAATPEAAAKIIESPAIASLLTHTEGTAKVNTVVEIDHGVRIHVTSDLVGLKANAPAPFNKSSEAAWPLRFDFEPCLTSERCASKMNFALADVLGLQLHYRDTDKGLKAQRGVLSVGKRLDRQPQVDGLAIYVQTPSLKWEDWENILNQANDKLSIDPKRDMKELNLNRTYVNIGRLGYRGLNFDTVRVDAQAYPSGAWSGDISSTLAKAKFNYTPRTHQSHPLLTANFDYLHIPRPEIVDKAMQAAPKETQSLPSVALTINDLRYQDYELGSLSVWAENEGKGPATLWKLKDFTLSNAEATLSANGVWDAGHRKNSRTQLEATLDVRDLGELLERFKLAHVINDGSGQLHTNLTWNGAPVDFNTESLNGTVSTTLNSGQILQVEPGAGRLLSLLSMQTLLRRLTFDFRDVVGQGFVFDSIVSNNTITNGVMKSNSFRLIGPQATILGEGTIDWNNMTQNNKITVLPDISLGGASLALAVANPILGVGSFIAQLALQAPLSNLLSTEYEITGSLYEPVITKVGEKTVSGSSSRAP
ncbi:MAG TPA: TIGR02099 family protein [Candidatus Aphodousia faecavium]|nr:TIGR02099 family protein [Candidatus Aphodousia faecavium]